MQHLNLGVWSVGANADAYDRNNCQLQVTMVTGITLWAKGPNKLKISVATCNSK